MHPCFTPLPYNDRIPNPELCELFAIFFAAMGAVQMATVSLLLRPKIRIDSTMNTANKLGPHTQTDRGTCPGVGL